MNIKTTELENTGEFISNMGLGTMYFGTKVDGHTSFKLLDIYYGAGGRFIDTANKYASWIPGFKGGESEALIGNWIKKRRNREGLFISTKVGFAYGDVPQSLKAKYIISECEKSLKRLGVETIDLYFAHTYDGDTPFEETLEAFHKLQGDGKVRHLGASNYFSWHLERARQIHTTNGWGPFCCLQQKYTLLQPGVGAYFGTQKVLTPDLNEYCRLHQMTVMAYSPLLSGVYSEKEKEIPAQYKTGDSSKRLKALEGIVAETGFTANQVVLAWMLQQNSPVLPLITGSNEEQLLENIGASSILLTEDQVKQLSNSPEYDIKYV